VALGEISFDAQAVLLIPISTFVHLSRLLLFRLQQFLDDMLHNLPPLLDASSKGRQRLFTFSFHLLGDHRVLLAHGFCLPSRNIQTCPQGTQLNATERFPRDGEQFLRVLLFEFGACLVEGFEFIAGRFGVLHSCEEWVDALHAVSWPVLLVPLTRPQTILSIPQKQFEKLMGTLGPPASDEAGMVPVMLVGVDQIAQRRNRLE